MAINKVVYGQNTVMDITDTTAVSNDVVNGKYFYLANGQKVMGNLSFVTYYTGSSEPVSSLGSNGDIYLKTV